MRCVPLRRLLISAVLLPLGVLVAWQRASQRRRHRGSGIAAHGSGVSGSGSINSSGNEGGQLEVKQQKNYSTFAHEESS